jgi:hypothetical protein
MLFVFQVSLGGGSWEVLSPHPRELFARFPVPVLIRSSSLNEQFELMIEVDGIEHQRVKSTKLAKQYLFETYLFDLSEGDHAFRLQLVQSGNMHGEEYFLFNISVNTRVSDKDLIRYIPPIMSVRPRVIHWLVSLSVEQKIDCLKRKHLALKSLFNEKDNADGKIANSFNDIFKQFVSKHNENMRNQKNSKYLIGRHFPTSGLGNLFQSIVSISLVALLSNRVLLFDSFLVEEFLEFPFFLSTNYSEIFENFGLLHIAQNSQHVVYKGEDWMLCESLESHLTEQFVFLESDMYFTAVLLNNEHYALQLQSIFGGKLFSTLSGQLFKLRPELEREVLSFYDEYLAGRPSIGMHIRTHTLGHPGFIEPYALQDQRGHFLNSYWKCASFVGSGWMPDEDGREAGSGESQGEHFAPVIFLASDHDAVRLQVCCKLLEGCFARGVRCKCCGCGGAEQILTHCFVLWAVVRRGRSRRGRGPVGARRVTDHHHADTRAGAAAGGEYLRSAGVPIPPLLNSRPQLARTR